MRTIDSQRPQVAYYTRPAFMDHSLPLVRALSDQTGLHMLVELSPEERAAGYLGEDQIHAPVGIHSADRVLRDGYLRGAGSFLKGLVSLDLVVHTDRRAFAPRSLAVAAAAAARVIRLRPDVLHLEDLTPRSAPVVFLTPGIPKVVAIHDARTHLGDAVGRAERIRRIALRRVDRLIFYSRFSQQQFAASGSMPPSTVIPLGPKSIWPEWSAEPVAEHDRTVLFFGRLSAYKGLDVLYAALPEISRQVPGVRIVVAGSPGGAYRLPPPPPLPCGAELVLQLGRIGPDLLRRLFLEATVIVLPYIEASQSGVVQTAFAFDKPVVATSVGGLPEVVLDGITGRLVPPRDPRALAAATVEVLQDEALRSRLRLGIRRLEEQEWGWHHSAAKFGAVYRSLIDTRR